MLGQHIKIMASIGADAPYIPIRGKGLRLISIASRYPSPGWKASERARARIHAHARLTRAHAYARKENHGSVRSIRYFCVTISTACTRVSRFCPLEKEQARFFSLCILPHHTLIFSLSASPIKLFLCFLRTRRRAIL